MEQRIFLIGYMAAGKTTVGKRLAQALGWSFVDLDLFMENRFRKSVSEIFKEKGEGGFREIEHTVLQEVAGFERTVISTGGGTPCHFDNMELMKRSGLTIYLQVSAEELSARLNVCKNTRPLLKDKTPEEMLRYVSGHLAERVDFYRQSGYICDAEKMLTGNDVEHITSHLLAYLERKNDYGHQTH